MRPHRTTRRGMAAAALALTLGLALAACSDDSAGGGATPTPTASGSTSADSAADQAALAEVKVEWTDATTKPTVTLPSTPFTVTTPVIDVREPGTGDTIAEGDVVSLNLAAVSGTDGSATQDTYSSTPQPVTMSADFVFHDELVGQKVGTRFVFAFPEQSAGAGTSVLAGEVVSTKTVPARASGEAVPPVAGLPTVTLDADGKPSLTPATGTPSTTLVVQPLIKGTGPAVTAGQTVTVKYTGWLWDGTQFDSSWDRGETYPVANIGQASVIAGWNEGLVGQTVGSQVLLVVPPDKGYGATANQSIPANSTLVFVVDILDAQ